MSKDAVKKWDITKPGNNSFKIHEGVVEFIPEACIETIVRRLAEVGLTDNQIGRLNRIIRDQKEEDWRNSFRLVLATILKNRNKLEKSKGD